MTRIHLILAAALALAACDEGDSTAHVLPNGPGASDPGAAAGRAALELLPRVQLIGLGDVHDAVAVDHLSFAADLYVLPDDVQDDLDGDAVAIRFTFDEGTARTEITEGRLRLLEPGRYRVLVRVRPDEAGVSVAVGGAYVLPEDAAGLPQHKADEPAPSPARGVEEPAPSPADEAAEPAPSPAEPAPSPAEPAPSPADEAGSDPAAEEPAPSPAEPAPSPARGTAGEPAPSPARARGKADDLGFDPGTTRAEGEALFVRSSLAYEFYAGTVDIAAGDHELVVTWDVRSWLRALLSEPLGLPMPAADVVERPAVPGFQAAPADFRVETR